MCPQGDLGTQGIAANLKNFTTPSMTQFSVTIALKERESAQSS